MGKLQEIKAHTMEYRGGPVVAPVQPRPYRAGDYEGYQSTYNQCFRPLRQALGLEPVDCCGPAQELLAQKENIFVLEEGGMLVAAVSLLGATIDDLIVAEPCRGRGMGGQMLRFAIATLQQRGAHPIRLSVAAWNQGALALYEKQGFVTVETQGVLRGTGGMDMVEFVENPALQPELLAYLQKCPWRAGPALARYLQAGDVFAPGDGIYFLRKEGQPLGFCTLSHRDCIEDAALFPWIGFVFIDEAHRGHRYSGLLLQYALHRAAEQGHSNVYLATDHVGFYEKYGFRYLENRLDIYGEDSRIYYYPLKPGAEE